MTEPKGKKPTDKPVVENEDEDDLDVADKLAAESDEKTSEKLEKISDPEALARNDYLQETLIKLNGLFTEFRPGADPKNREEDFKAWTKGIEEQRKNIQLEREQGVFGPATAKAYAQYKDWLEKVAVPGAVRSMDGYQLAMPPGCPIALPFDQQQRALNPELYKALASADRNKLDLQVDTKRVPTEAEMDKLDNTFGWLTKCHEALKAAQNRQRDDFLVDMIERQGLPKKWLEGREINPDAWRSSAAEMVDLSLRSRNYVEAMQSLFKDSHYRDFPLQFPPGTSITVDSNGKQRTFTDRDLVDPAVRSILGNAKITGIKLDLPEDLRQENPANKQKIERLRQWLDKYGDQIDQCMVEYKKFQENPDAIVMYGDQEWSGGWKGRFNGKDEFVGMALPGYQGAPGEQLKEVNLTGYDFKTEKLDNGKIRVTQTIKAENAPIYAYQNIRMFGVEQVGKEMPVESKEYDPEDWVPVKDGGKIQIVKAKNLDDFRTTQRNWYVGEKVAVAVADGLIVFPPAVELSVALRSARLATKAGEVALKLSGKQLAWEMTKDAGKVAIGMAGVFNNAGARDTSWGQAVNTARGLYFLGDISKGLVQGSFRLARGAKLGQELSGAEKVHTLIHGRKAAEGVKPLEGIPFVKQLHTGGQWGFKASEASFIPILWKDIGHQIDEIANKHKDHLRDAAIQVGDGRGLQKAEKGSFDVSDPRKLEGAQQLLDNYAATLKDGRKPETQEKVQDIIDRTKQLLGPKATDKERAQYRDHLLRSITFTAAEVQQMENKYAEEVDSRSYQLTEQQVHDLMDPIKRREFPKSIRETAEKILAEKDADVVAASQIGLLYLSRDKDGKISEQLARVPLDIPEYKRTITIPGHGDSPDRTETITIKPRSLDASLSAGELVDTLKRDLESPSLGNRGIATGDALLRIGGITHQQYGGVLQDVLTNKNSSKSDRMKALTDTMSSRFATIIDGIRHQETENSATVSAEARDRALGKSFGLSSADFLRTLEETAKKDTDADVRAMAAALVHGLREREASDRAALLITYNEAWQALKNKPDGTFAKEIAQHLKAAQAAIVDESRSDKELQRERKLNAALALSMMSDTKDAATQNEISRAMAGCFSESNLSINLQVMRELIPERIKELSKSDPDAANKLRQKAIDFLQVPDTVDQMSQMAGIMQRMKALVFDSFPEGGDNKLRTELTQQLATKYKDMLDPSRRKQFAQYSPDMRAAAIQGLADLGARDQASLDLIHKYISSQKTYAIGEKTVEAGENDARVRSAAAYALKRLNDSDLKNIVIDLIDKETDPQVAQQLRDIEFDTRRIEPDSREYKQMYEAALKEIIDPAGTAKYEYLKKWGDGETLEWLKANYPNMNIKDFMAHTNSLIQGEIPVNRFWSLKETEAYEEYKIISKKMDKRWEQWTDLCKQAKGDGEEANKAKMALGYILNHPDYMGASGLTLEFEGDKYKKGVVDSWKRLYNHDYAEMAARALTECSGAGCGGRDLTAHIIRMGLGYQQNMQPHVSLELLKGWNNLAVRSEKMDREDELQMKQRLVEHWKKEGKAPQGLTSDQEQKLQTELFDRWRALSTRTDKLSPEEEKLKAIGDSFKPPLFAMTKDHIAKVTAKALELELLRQPGNQAEWYQQALIEELKKQNHRMVFPVIEALAKDSAFAGVKADAAKMLADLRDSVSLMWNNTQPDRTTSSADRAQALKTALDTTQKQGEKKTEKTVETTVQQIFNATAGLDLRAGDPCLNYLALAMNEKTERVRLAAAMVVAQSKLDPSDPVKQKAINVLVDISINGSRDGYKKDAAELLKPLKENNKNALLAPLGQALMDNPKAATVRAELDALVGKDTHTINAGDGKQLRLRKINNELVVEEMVNGTVTRASMKEGVNYAQLMLNEALDIKVPPMERFLRARDVIANPALSGGKAEDLEKARRILLAMAGSDSTEEKARMEAAKFVATEKSFTGDDGKLAREKAFAAFVELATHGKDTREEAQRIITGDTIAQKKAAEYLSKGIEELSSRGASPALISQKLEMLAQLCKKGDSNTEAALYSACLAAERTIGANAATLNTAAGLLNRSAGTATTALTGKDDPRLKAMVSALNSGNDIVRTSAALALTDKSLPSDIATEKDLAAARQIISQHLSQLTSDARALEDGKVADSRTVARAWSAVESVYKHIGADPDSYAHTYATMKRMAAELGPKHRDMAAIYDKMAALAAKVETQDQVNLYTRRAKEARGEVISELPKISTGVDISRRIEEAQVLASKTDDPQNLKRAIAQLEGIVAEARTAGGNKGTLLASALTGLGVLKTASGDGQAAEQALKEAVKLYEESADNNSPEALKASIGLTRHYVDTKNTAGFENEKRKILDPTRFAGTRETKLTSSQALMDLADYIAASDSNKEVMNDAQTMLEKAVKLKVEGAGDNTIEAAMAKQVLADFFMKPGNPNADLRKAEKILNDSLTTLENAPDFTLGENWATTQGKLAHCMRMRGDYAGAMDTYGQALDVMLRTPQKDPAKMAQIQREYAQILKDRGRMQDANQLLTNPAQFRQNEKKNSQVANSAGNP